MTFTSLKQRLSKFKWRGAKSINSDHDGVAAVEFALIAPVLVFLYFGGIELSLLMQADRRITTVTATIGDLTSRATVIDNEELRDIFSASNQLVLPLDPSQAEMRVTSLVSDANGNITVDWSDDCNAVTLRAFAEGTPIDDIPEGILPDSSSIIMAEVQYLYSSSIAYLPTARDVELQDRFFLRPRRSDNITRNTTGMRPCPAPP